MTKVRVFEFAKELNMPSKQLIQKMQSWGLSTDDKSNFSALTDEQITFIKAKLAGNVDAVSEIAPSERKKRVIRRAKADSTVLPPSQDTDEKKPRRVRKIRKKVETEDLPTESTDTLEAKLESEQPTPVSSEIPEKPAKNKKEVISSQKEEPQPSIEVEERQTQNEDNKKPKPQESNKKDTPPLKTGDLTDDNKKPIEVKTDLSEKPIKKNIEFEKFDHKKDEGKESKKEKKGSRFLEKPTDEIRPKRNLKKVYILDDDGETREKSYRKNRRRNKNKSKFQAPKHTFNPRKKSIKIGPAITVGELAGEIGIKVAEIIKKLMSMGTMASINQNISGEIAELIAAEFNVEIELNTATVEDALQVDEDNQFEQIPRAPIVTIMGHVDHGKTSLLDKIRTTQVTNKEAGGITQHIGAYHVNTAFGDVTFLDTPGHEAFTAMRARGANVTDIVILVVAADDGVQPQTIEAIHHAQAANVPIIVTINKIDRPDANPTRVQQELLEHSLISEEFGGETIFIKASAHTGEGIEQLLEMIHLQAEILELKAHVEGKARGTIVESHISKGRGPIGTVLIQEGTLNVGDHYVVGATFGKVRALYDDSGSSIESAKPSFPAEVVGFNDVPDTGEPFIVLDDEKTARQIAENRAHKNKDEIAAEQHKIKLESLFDNIKTEDHVELKLLLKADVLGSIEAIRSSLLQLESEIISINFLHTATGSITENDVILASASNAIILGFNTSLEATAKTTNAHEGVDIRLYDVIYDAIDDVKKAIEGLLKPTLRDEVVGRCEVRQIFTAAKTGQILGCYVTEGKIVKESFVRIFRKDDMIHEGDLVSLKRFKEDVREVANNYECGVVVDHSTMEIGDIIESYIQIEEAARL